MYSALPVELRDKLTKDLLANPGKVGKDLVNMLGPQVQNLIAGFAGNLGKSNLNYKIMDFIYLSPCCLSMK